MLTKLLTAAMILGSAALTSRAQPVEGRSSFSPSDIVLREMLVIGGVGRYGRSPVHTDAVEALLVSGKWTAPQAGQVLTLPDLSLIHI